MLTFFLTQHIWINSCDACFFGLGEHIERRNHGNHKDNDWIADSDNLRVFISEDEGDEIPKRHQIKEDDKDLIANTISLASFVFVERARNSVYAFDEFFSEGFFFHKFAPFLKIFLPKETVEVSLEAAGEIETEFQGWIVLVVLNHIDGLSRDTDILG